MNIENSQSGFKKIKLAILNPKSIKNEEIYGQLNEITKEYTKGLVPVLFNNAVEN